MNYAVFMSNSQVGKSWYSLEQVLFTAGAHQSTRQDTKLKGTCQEVREKIFKII